MESSIGSLTKYMLSDPFNTATQASKMAVDYLKSIRYNDMLYLYGDASTRNGNTIDEEKRFVFSTRQGWKAITMLRRGYGF